MRFNYFKLMIIYLIVFLIVTGNVAFSAETYKVSINDVLDIRVLGHPEVSIAATVSADGTITVPYIGSVNVKGMTLSDIKEEITNRLSEGYVKYPSLSISLVRASIRKVYLYGYFNLRSPIGYEDNMTVLMALSMGGGASVDGLYGKLKIIRKQKDKTEKYKEILEAKLNDGLLEEKEVENMLLQTDDILIIERSKTFLIQGEVALRGRVNLEEGMTVTKALSLAGGVTQDGRYGIVKLIRKNQGLPGGNINVIETKLNDGFIEDNEIGNTRLQPDDTLIVERSKTLLIQGEVLKRGRFVLEKDMTVVRALLDAGGVSIEGLYGKVIIRRKLKEATEGYTDIAESDLNNGAIENKEVENMLLKPDDLLVVERNKTFLIQGEVANRGRFTLEKDITVVRALLQAGGASANSSFGKVRLRRKLEGEKYTDIAESNLNNGDIENKEIENMLLQTEDILVVEKNKTYFIYGEAMKTGEFILSDNMTVFKALTIAGGLTKWGSKSKVKVLRTNSAKGFETIKVRLNDVINGDAAADVNLQPGDIIMVSEGIL